MRLDTYDRLPDDMRVYLSNYGWHFSKTMCEHAVNSMSDRNGSKIQPMDREKVETLFKQYGVEIPQEKFYDAMYVLHMAKSDFYGSSIVDEAHLAKYVNDYINDKDGYDEIAFTRYYADCIGKGIPIHWDRVL